MELGELRWFGIFSGSEFIYKLPHGDVVVNVIAVYTSQEFKGELNPDTQEANEVRFFR